MLRDRSGAKCRYTGIQKGSPRGEEPRQCAAQRGSALQAAAKEGRKKKRGMIPFRATDGDKSHGKHAVQSAVLKRSDLRGEQW